MRMTKVLLATAVAALFATPVFAQAKPVAKTAAVKDEQKGPKKETKAAKKEEHAEHKAFEAANAAPKKWLAAVPKITKAERAQINTIEKKYTAQIATLKKDHMAAEKAGTEDDSQIGAKVQALLDQEKAELRSALTLEQQTKFDTKPAKSGK